MNGLPLTSSSRFKARAVLCGERIDARAFEQTARLAVAPLVVSAGRQGCAVIFRYGVVVFFDVSPAEEVAFLHALEPLLAEPASTREVEEIEIQLEAGREERIEAGVLYLSDAAAERFQLVADVLAKSVVLGYYETGIAGVFDRIEPLAAGLRSSGSISRQGKALLRHVGETLAVQQQMVGRVEVDEKPELLWDRPQLERLYLRLSEEFELRDRSKALDRKLELVYRTAGALLDLLQDRRNLRVEWYIVLLILVEIALSLYQMFFRG